MAKRVSTRLSSRNSKCNILLSDIKYNSTCITLDLPFSLCCDSCSSTLEAQRGLLKKSSHKLKRFRDLSERRRCQQPWSSEHNNPYKPTTTIQKFVRVRNYLKIDSEIEITNSYFNDTRKKSKPQNRNKTSDCNTEGTTINSSHVQPELLMHTSVDSVSILPTPSPSQTKTVPSSVPITNLDLEFQHTVSSPSHSPSQPPTTTFPTHANLPNNRNSPLDTNLNKQSSFRPSYPPSARSPVQPEMQSNMQGDTQVTEPTRLSTSTHKDSLYVTISRRKLQHLEKEAAIGRKFLLAKKRKQYKSTKLGRLLQGIAIAHATKIGMNTLEKIITLSTMAFCANMGFNACDLECIAKMCPSASTLKTLMIDLAVDCVIMMSEEMKDKKLSLMCDKGEDSGTGASFVKLTSFFDCVRKRVVVRCFGIEQAGNSSKDAAIAIDHALKLFEYCCQTRKRFTATMTDAGGGGVGSSLYKNLVTVDRAIDSLDHIWGTCTLHALNIMFSVPVETIMGTGGLKKRTFLQMLHTAYSLKNLYANKCWKEMWLIATGTTWKDISCPVMSRWQHVGEGAQHIEKYRKEWLVMCQYICDLNNVGTVKNDISSYLYSYLNEDILIAYLHFVCAFVETFFDPHFNWHKHIDATSQRPGFLSVHSGIHFYVMDRDMQNLQENWKTIERFALFRSVYPNNITPTIDSFVSDFFKLSKQRMHKHMNQWRTRNLPLVLGGDHKMAQYVAGWLLDQTNATNDNETYQSEKHNTEINVQACGRFLTDLSTASEHHGKTIFAGHRDGIVKLSEGEALWTSIIPSVVSLRDFITSNFVSFGSNNQLTERWVKDSNECTYLKKDEKMANIFAMVRSCTVLQYQEDANELLHDRTRKGNKYFELGKVGERVDKRTGSVEVPMANSKDSEIRGSIFLGVVLKCAVQMEIELDKVDSNSSARQQIKQHLLKEDLRFETVLRNTEIGNLVSAMNKPHKRCNAIQSEKGVENTAFMRQEIKYSKVLTKHIDLVRDELTYLGIEFESNLKIRKLMEHLRVYNKTLKQKDFTDLHGHPPRDTDLDLLHFKPRHKTVLEWRDAYCDS